MSRDFATTSRPEGASNRGDRHIVVGQADPAAREHDLEVAAELAHFRGQELELVGQHDDAFQANPDGAQDFGELAHVRVGDFSAQDLVADHERGGRANDAWGHDRRLMAVRG